MRLVFLLREVLAGAAFSLYIAHALFERGWIYIEMSWISQKCFTHSGSAAFL